MPRLTPEPVTSKRRAPRGIAAILLASALTGAAAAQDRAPDRSYWDYDLSALETPGSGSRACPAFFDQDPATPAQPAPPEVSAFGRAVLRACGPLGGRVGEAEFEALVADHLDQLRPQLPTAWNGRARAEILDRLKRLWLSHEAFDHVFCGEWDRRRIGGLHFRGRYLQLQAEGAACYRRSDREEILEGRVYSLGVASADGRHEHPIKGYALTQSAADLFGLGTRAAAACCQAGSTGWQRRGGVYGKAFYAPSGAPGAAVLNRVVCRAEDPADPAAIGLVTLYSDASPDPRAEICPQASE